MRELAWVVAALLGAAALGAVRWAPWEPMLEAGNELMLGAATLAVPLELVYFAALGLALRASGAPPKGWYWRSFDHHDRLGLGAKWVVLPFFYVGTLCMLATVLGIGLVLLALIGAAVQE